jgi:hypothetical protein
MDQAQGTVAEQIGQKLSVSVQDEGRDDVRGLDQLRGPSGRPWFEFRPLDDDVKPLTFRADTVSIREIPAGSAAGFVTAANRGGS